MHSSLVSSLAAHQHHEFRPITLITLIQQLPVHTLTRTAGASKFWRKSEEDIQREEEEAKAKKNSDSEVSRNRDRADGWDETDYKRKSAPRTSPNGGARPYHGKASGAKRMLRGSMSKIVKRTTPRSVRRAKAR